ncbi:TetR/AcrR family transcriptional regulator [Microbacterium sp. p3-SID336]|uniref:TetR/AcrR family transcriptional regulator n=1 Tax=Microbacterium sp. p3-SID336 TaxID=2916212 RepID=UPI0021A7BD8E|nr:TetR/AcrR family transcriptional regulator [Microbacterium sp. p3-SID336]MCT1479920.1 TetR/AcrR family transcriptional regulator [Microbacterium sp. p3-SID336]
MSGVMATRGTRPANRRALILDAAATLFAQRGYEHVSVRDIADAVQVGPSALYRHFPGKEHILAEVLSSALDGFRAEIDASSNREECLAALSAFILDHRDAGVLWQRESRHLPAGTSPRVQAALRDVRDAFAAAVSSTGETSAATTAALAVLLSPAFTRSDLARSQHEELLAELAERALRTPIAANAPERPRGPGRPRVSPRARLVSSAMRLFAAGSYAGVSVEELAADVGLATGSLYSHLPTKQDLLVIALTHADGHLQLGLDRILAETADPRTALHRLAASYAEFAMGHPDIVDALVTEVHNLPAEQARAMRGEQRAYVDEWSHLLQEVHPALTSAAATITVQAALSACNDLARNPSVRTREDAESLAARVCLSVLDA